jgi:hypothetical protein
MYSCKHQGFLSSEPCKICHVERSGRRKALDKILEMVRTSDPRAQSDIAMLAWESQLPDYYSPFTVYSNAKDFVLVTAEDLDRFCGGEYDN